MGAQVNATEGLPFTSNWVEAPMRRIWLLIIAAVLLFAPSGFAQGSKKTESQNRSVQGVVTSSTDQNIAGAVVQLKNLKSLEIRSFITKEDGTYYFHGLSPDVDYELRADYQGSSSGTKTLSSFDSRKQATINLKLNKK
jgi:Carboxypeptidase regulatory-like domain